MTLRSLLLLLFLTATTGFAAEPASTELQALLLQLKNGTPQEIVTAADKISRLGEAAKPAIQPLLDAIAGKSSWVDMAVMDSLSNLGPVAFPTLMEKFQNDDLENRIRCGRVFWAMGIRAREARPLLVKALQDKEKKMVDLATLTLKKMDAEIAEENLAAVKTASTAPAIVNAPATAPAPTTQSRDWPGFRGLNRDGLCTETGLLKSWPESGPKLLWQLDTLGKGYSTLAIAKGRFFTCGDRELNGQKSQFVIAFDLATHAELWATPIGLPYKEHGAISTPTIDGDLLYVISTEGDLFCLQTESGKVVWQKGMVKELGGKISTYWKYSESALVDGDRVICTPGGPEAMMAAFNKKSGELIWKCAIPSLGERGKDGAGYSSAIVAEIEGVRQYVQVIGRGLIGVSAESGKFLWGYNKLANEMANITNPIARGNYVFTANSYNTGSALLRIKKQGDAFQVEEVYVLPAKTFENHHGGVLLIGDHLYGGSGLNKGDPTCLDFATGKVMWKTKFPAGSSCVAYADGQIIFRHDRGLITLVEATPTAYQTKGAFTPPRTDSPAWTYPVVHDRKMYIRDQQLLFCYDLSSDAK